VPAPAVLTAVPKNYTTGKKKDKQSVSVRKFNGECVPCGGYYSGLSGKIETAETKQRLSSRSERPGHFSVSAQEKGESIRALLSFREKF